MELMKITKQNCSREFMTNYLADALQNKKITKKSFNEWKDIVLKIEAGEGTASAKYKAVKEAFYERYIKPEKEKAKKSVHPLFDMFNKIEIVKASPIQEQKE